MTKAVYNIVKVKPGKDPEGKRFYQQVGKLIMRDNGNGTIFLHMMDGDFAVFPKTEQPAAAAAGVPF